MKKTFITAILLVFVILLLLLSLVVTGREVAREEQLLALQGTQAALLQKLDQLQTLMVKNPPPIIIQPGSVVTIPVPVP